MLSAVHVPRPLLVLCCVLRAMIAMTSSAPLLSLSELDSFLATAVCLRHTDIEAVQEQPVHNLTTRGIHLAQLFMQVGSAYARVAHINWV